MITNEEYKWCCAFIAYSLEQDGYKLPPHTWNMYKVFQDEKDSQIKGEIDVKSRNFLW